LGRCTMGNGVFGLRAGGVRRKRPGSTKQTTRWWGGKKGKTRGKIRAGTKRGG